MLVLDYVRRTDVREPTLVIPPFHTGHLGFLPETPVRVSLVASRDPRFPHRHCEVVVTPFTQEWRYLALVSATMRDEPGVVARLLTAVASLGMNIEVQESSSIDLLDHHFVNLIVDLAESPTPHEAEFSAPSMVPQTPTAVRRLYRDFESVLPVHDDRFVRLFESIVTHCADVIVWKPVSGRYLPEISIRPMPEYPFSKSGFATLRQQARDTSKIEVDLPPGIVNRIHNVLGVNQNNSDCLQYIAISDTTTRSLRAFFIHPESTKRLFHVGFYHNDVPGALATILSLLRAAEFNILTSLARNRPDGRAVWEAIIEYQGEAEVPALGDRQAHSPLKQQELKWLCDIIANAADQSEMEIVDCDFYIDRPRYPRHKDAKPVKAVSLSERLSAKASPYRFDRNKDFGELLAAREAGLANPDLDKGVVAKSRELLGLLRQVHAEQGRSTVFLSYPHTIATHAIKLKNRLEDDLSFRVEEYQRPDGEVIVEEVLRKIEDSDYFIGIWHHEGAAARRTRNISPWMLFEYGVALAADKPAIVVHSDRLHPSVWNRVNAGIANPAYADVSFESDTIPLILEYCAKHFTQTGGGPGARSNGLRPSD